MKRVELLLPAGNIEKMEYAVSYGADAVYLGIAEFSLRSMRKGELITAENLKKAVNTAHSLGAKVYVTCNIYAHNENITELRDNIGILNDAKPDGVIFSDPGIFNLLRKELKDIPFHVSTQANTLNYEAVKFWQDLGAKRVILARELAVSEIAEIKSKVPDIEIESFIHGSQCVSLSGRCLLSDYMTEGERKANQGGCCQPCRWSYKLLEETRPGQYFEIEQGMHGTHILSPKDLCLVEYIPQLIDAGVDSLKIEGRTKSVYYASAVAKAYRTAIDAHYEGRKIDPSVLVEDLKKVGNRQFTTGFYIGGNDSNGYNYEMGKSIAGETFMGMIRGKQDSHYNVKIKNQIHMGREVEIITPKSAYIAKVTHIIDPFDNETEIAKTNDDVLMSFDKDTPDWEKAIIRSIGENNAL